MSNIVKICGEINFWNNGEKKFKKYYRRELNYDIVYQITKEASYALKTALKSCPDFTYI